MSQKAYMLWTRVDCNIRKMVEKIAETQGITISEYIRQLVIEDLDKRSVFTTILKQSLEADGRKVCATRLEPPG